MFLSQAEGQELFLPLLPAVSAGQEGVKPFQPCQAVLRMVQILCPLSRATPGPDPALFGLWFQLQ